MTLVLQWPTWARWRLSRGLDALRARASAQKGWVGGFVVEKEGRGRQGLKLLCFRRSIAPLSVGRITVHVPASIGAHSMSGIANSTQPVAVAARKERQSGLKNAKSLSRCGGRRAGALDHHQQQHEHQHHRGQPGSTPTATKASRNGSPKRA